MLAKKMLIYSPKGVLEEIFFVVLRRVSLPKLHNAKKLILSILVDKISFHFFHPQKLFQWKISGEGWKQYADGLTEHCILVQPSRKAQWEVLDTS